MGGITCEQYSINLINGHSFNISKVDSTTGNITLQKFTGNYENCTRISTTDGRMTSLISVDDTQWNIIEFDSSNATLNENEVLLKVNYTGNGQNTIVKGDIVLLSNVNRSSLDSIAGQRYAVTSVVSKELAVITLILCNVDIANDVYIPNGNIG